MKYLPFLVLLLAVLGCGNSTSVSTGRDETPAHTRPMKLVVNQTKSFGGLNVSIAEVAFEDGKITVGMTLTNTTKETLTVYPDQGQLVAGKHQVDANGFMTNGDLSGEIHPGIEKSGSIAFPDTGRIIDSTKPMELRLGTVLTRDMKGGEIKFPLPSPTLQ